MMSLYGGQGMGSAGLGAGASPSIPNSMNPQVLAMLQAMAGGGQTAQPMTGGAPTAPAMATPMAGYIGAGGNPGMMHQMPTMPVAPNPAPQQAVNPMAQMAQTAQGMSQMQDLMNKMKIGQSGVPANLPPAQNPESTGGALNWLQSLFAGGGGGAIPPAGGMT